MFAIRTRYSMKRLVGTCPIIHALPLPPSPFRVATQHGHSAEVMLRMYAAWLDGATEADIHAIKQTMEMKPAARASKTPVPHAV